ncbi:MAG: hypothetical protein H6650_06360 [Ardenticatenales bacterium]|nr:hypothetical protein [Ardenticatenales bacterium]
MTFWRTITANAFWLMGLAIMVASFSYHYWQAVALGQPFRQQRRTTSFRASAWSGLVLVCLGMGATSSRTWEAAVWYALTLLSLLNIAPFLPWFRRHR